MQEALTREQEMYAELMQDKLGLSDWDIRYRFSEEDADCFAKVDTRLDYHEAVITIYPIEIAESVSTGFNEHIERLILHELCEVAIEIAFGPLKVPYNSFERHKLAWLSGEDNDPESGLPHLSHMLANLAFIATYTKRGIGQDFRPMKARLVPGSIAGFQPATVTA